MIRLTNKLSRGENHKPGKHTCMWVMFLWYFPVFNIFCFTELVSSGNTF